MSNYQLAQMNIARLLAPIDSPQLQDFVANLDRINALAESSPGFVWRLVTPATDAAFRPLGDDTIINMSVWSDLVALNQFVYRSAHVEIMRRRREWFDRMVEAYVVLWWVRRDHIPSVEEGFERLTHMRQHGPTPHAFNFRAPFPPPDESGAADLSPLAADCPT